MLPGPGHSTLNEHFLLQMLSLFHRLLLGGLLLLTLIAGLSLLVRKSFVALSELDSQQTTMDRALGSLAVAQASVAREQILIERSLLHLPPEAGSPAPTVNAVNGTPRESDIRTQFQKTHELLQTADVALASVPAAPRLGAEIAQHGKILARHHNAPPEYLARMQSARELEPVGHSLSAKLDSLRSRRWQTVAQLEAQRQSLRARLIGACGACILTAIALIAGCLFYVLQPLHAAARVAKRMGQGELQNRIAWQGHDDLGTIATEYNRMAIRLRDLLETEGGRRAMEQQLSDAVVQSIFEPVIVTDGRGQLLRLNGAARELLGEGAGDRMVLSSTPGGDKILSAIHAAITMQGSAATEGEAAAMVPVRMGTGKRNYRLRTTPMRDNEGHLLGAVSVLEDVTELQDLDRFKTRFLTVASRKLRDPLEKLRVALHALAHGYAGELNALQADVLDGAQKEAADLDDLMADLFAVAELESGNRTLRLEALRPLDMLREAQANVRSLATQKNIELFIDAYGDLRRVQADRRAMRSIFENLLSNAVQHTPADGIIRLIARESKGFVQFSISDTGQGIPPERLPAIFGRFNSGESDGTALGLALVRRLVESHGGQVSVESRVGVGSTFSFTLPVVEQQESRHPVEAG